ncbi:respiratory nitrate reductase subunit gamma [Spirillospora sp. CA-108201]
MTGDPPVLAAGNGADPGVAGILLWVALPYVAVAVFVLGHIWRYRYDKFGWTTRSSQLYERRLLRVGSPLFHFGIILVALGRVGGLLIPESWTEAVGVTEGVYHAVAVLLGTVAGFCTLSGLAMVVANIVGGGYDYRDTVSPRFRSIFYLRPDPGLMTGVPILSQLHAVSALVLFGIWPFTRLVHMLTAPVGYLTRPYIVYRSRDEQLGMHRPRRGWERAT